MQQSKPKSAASLTKDDVIVIHPYTGRRGEWLINAIGNECRRHVDIALLIDDENVELVTLANNQPVQVRATVEEIQHDCAMALTHITRQGLPPVQWAIGASDPVLAGTLSVRKDRDIEADVAAWAEWLEVEPVFRPTTDPEKFTVDIEGEFMGVRVAVYAYSVPAPAEEKAEAKA